MELILKIFHIIKKNRLNQKVLPVLSSLLTGNHKFIKSYFFLPSGKQVLQALTSVGSNAAGLSQLYDLSC